jgi:hypothetical protein
MGSVQRGLIRMRTKGTLNGYEVYATAATLQTTGVRASCSDASGVVRFVIPGAAIGLAAGVATLSGVAGPVGN